MEAKDIYAQARTGIRQIPLTRIVQAGSDQTNIMNNWNNGTRERLFVGTRNGVRTNMQLYFNGVTLKPWEYMIIAVDGNGDYFYVDDIDVRRASDSYYYIMGNGLSLTGRGSFTIDAYYTTGPVWIYKVQVYVMSRVVTAQPYNVSCSHQYLADADANGYDISMNVDTFNTLNCCMTCSDDFDTTITFMPKSTTQQSGDVTVTYDGGSDTITATKYINTIDFDKQRPISVKNRIRFNGISVPKASTQQVLSYTSAVNLASLNVPQFNTYKMNYILPMEVKPSDVHNLQPNNVAQWQTNDITITWEATLYANCFLYVGDKTYRLLDSNTRSYTIPRLTFTPGNYQMHLEAYPYEGSAEGRVDLTGTLVVVAPPNPQITAFEPNGVAQLDSNAINITWTTDIQDRYKLVVGTLVFEGGTDVRSVTIPANALPQGDTNMTLEVWGYPGTDVGKSTVNASFIVYGKPTTPTLQVEAEYWVNMPTFTWESDGQVAYELKILQGATIKQNTGTVVSDAKSFKTNLLSAGTYTVQLRVRNKYDLWSDWTEATFEVKEATIDKPTIDQTIITTKPSVIVSYTAIADATKLEIYRTKADKGWTKIYEGTNTGLYEDFAIGSNSYSYKVRVYKGSTANESEISTIETTSSITHFNFTALKSGKSVKLIYEPQLTCTLIDDKALIKYEGRSAPSAEVGDTNYHVYTFSFVVTDEQHKQFIDVVNTNENVFYCDHRGNDYYFCITDVEYTPDIPGWGELSFKATEVGAEQ